MAMTTASVIGIATALASTGLGVYSSMQQEQNQKAQAQYQANMANYNAQVAEQQAQIAEAEGDEIKRQSYEDSLKKRQEAANLVGKQRAAQAASGITVDTGSALDANLDTTERGEIDAFQIKEQGAWQDYDKRVQAWNYRNQAAASQSTAAMHNNKASAASPFLAGATSALSGAKKINSAFTKTNK